MSRAVVTACVVAAVVAAVWGILHVGWYATGQITDYGVYQQYGNDIVVHHAVPYRDFRVEYPPAAIPMFVLPSWIARDHYNGVFQILMALCHFALVLAVLRLAGRWAAGAAAVAPLLLGSVVVSRFDLWPTALTALALAALVAEQLDLASILAGTAFAAKLWPAVVVPFMVVWTVRTYGRAAAVRFAGVAAAAAAAWFVPFAVIAPARVGYPFHAQFARPLQIESLGSSILILVHDLFGKPIRVIGTFGSQNLAGYGTHTAAVLTTVVEVIVLLVLFLLYLRAGDDAYDLLLSCAAAVAALLAFGKVFSPQFLIWLFPFVWIARGRRALAAVPTAVAALVFTQLYFPHRYWDLATGFTRPQVAELVARNLACVALVVAWGWPRRLQHELFGEHRSRLEALQRVRTQIN